jgi:hypothetical protein
MNPAPDSVFHDYLIVLHRGILDLRTRIRCADEVTLDEVHDLLDAIHNIPAMLLAHGGWFVPENIDADLARYDSKWSNAGAAKLRSSLLRHLESARARAYDDAY